MQVKYGILILIGILWCIGSVSATTDIYGIVYTGSPWCCYKYAIGETYVLHYTYQMHGPYWEIYGGPAATVTYLDAYSISVVASSACSGSATVDDYHTGHYIQYQIEFGYAPTASFTSNTTTGISPLGVQFNDTSANSPTSWNWSFGDGTFSTSRNATHTYSSDGYYNVSLKATNNFGYNFSNQTSYIHVTGTPGVAFSGNQTSGNASLFIHFTDSSSGSPTAWSWNFGDGLYSTTQNPTHEYTTPGVYSVTLTATNAYGDGVLTKSSYITVYPPVFNLDDISIDGFLTDAIYRDRLNAFTVQIVKGYINAQGNFVALDDPVYVTTNGLDPNTGYYAKYDLPAGEIL
jgi:PKD repeat protein